MCDLYELGLSVRSFDALQRAGIRSINSLLIYIVSGKNLRKLRGIGKTSEHDILENLLSFLKWKNEGGLHDL